MSGTDWVVEVQTYSGLWVRSMFIRDEIYIAAYNAKKLQRGRHSLYRIRNILTDDIIMADVL